MGILMKNVIFCNKGTLGEFSFCSHLDAVRDVTALQAAEEQVVYGWISQ